MHETKSLCMYRALFVHFKLASRVCVISRPHYSATFGPRERGLAQRSAVQQTRAPPTIVIRFVTFCFTKGNPYQIRPAERFCAIRMPSLASLGIDRFGLHSYRIDALACIA